MTPLIVTGDGVCLRAKADGESEVVWQVSSGTVLQGTGDGSNWVEVLAPGEVSVWMAADFVSNGVVQASKAYVRAGPGMNYSAVGTAQRNDKVDVRGESRGWIKIGPPASCRLWISRLYVKSVPEKKQAGSRQAPSPVQTVVSPPPVAVSVPSLPASMDVPGYPDARPAVLLSKAPAVSVPPASSVATHAAVPSVSPGATVKATTEPIVRRGPRLPPALPAALKRFEADADADQGRQALYRGTMGKCNWLLSKPADYRLVVRHQRRGVVTLCYVSGDSVLLATLEGKRVALSGREYRLKGVEQPVVVYESVVEDAANSTGAVVEPITP